MTELSLKSNGGKEVLSLNGARTIGYLEKVKLDSWLISHTELFPGRLNTLSIRIQSGKRNHTSNVNRTILI